MFVFLLQKSCLKSNYVKSQLMLWKRCLKLQTRTGWIYLPNLVIDRLNGKRPSSLSMLKKMAKMKPINIAQDPVKVSISPALRWMSQVPTSTTNSPLTSGTHQKENGSKKMQPHTVLLSDTRKERKILQDISTSHGI